MVRVLWHGHSCFELQGRSVIIVTDHFKGVGILKPKATADIVLDSHGYRDHNNIKLVLGMDGQAPESFIGFKRARL